MSYQPATRAVISTSHRPVWEVRATDAAGNQGATLDVLDGTVTFDESWSPHVQASLTCRVPGGIPLDPRRHRLRIDAGYAFPSGTQDVEPLVDLRIRAAPTQQPDDTIQISAEGEEYAAQRAISAYGSNLQTGHAGVAEMLSLLIRDGTTPRNPTITNLIGAGYEPSLVDELTMEATDDYWSVIDSVAKAADVWVRDVGNGTWTISHRPTIGTPVHELRTGAGGTVTKVEADAGTDDWANRVIVRVTYSDGSTQVSMAQVTTGPYAVTSVGVYARSYDARYQPGGGPAIANSILSRVINHATRRSMDAISAYWVRPGDTITDATAVPATNRLVESVSFRYPSGAMTIQTREE